MKKELEAMTAAELYCYLHSEDEKGISPKASIISITSYPSTL
jgi:hypothetical protein